MTSRADLVGGPMQHLTSENAASNRWHGGAGVRDSRVFHRAKKGIMRRLKQGILGRLKYNEV